MDTQLNAKPMEQNPLVTFTVGGDTLAEASANLDLLSDRLSLQDSASILTERSDINFDTREWTVSLVISGDLADAYGLALEVSKGCSAVRHWAVLVQATSPAS